MPFALRYGLLGYAPLSEGAVQPYVADSKVCAFPNDLRGYSRVSHNHHSFDWFRDRMEIGIARVPLHLRDIRIDRIDMVTRAHQLSVYSVGRLLNVPRDASLLLRNSDTCFGAFDMTVYSLNYAERPSSANGRRAG